MTDLDFIKGQIKKHELQLELLNLGMLAKAEQLKGAYHETSISTMKSAIAIIDDAQSSLYYYKGRLKEELDKEEDNK